MVVTPERISDYAELVHYYYTDKNELIAAALRWVEQQDLTLVEPDPALTPEEQLRAALRRVADPEFLTTEYLALRLQLWALGQADEAFAEINSGGRSVTATGWRR